MAGVEMSNKYFSRLPVTMNRRTNNRKTSLRKKQSSSPPLSPASRMPTKSLLRARRGYKLNVRSCLMMKTAAYASICGGITLCVWLCSCLFLLHYPIDNTVGSSGLRILLHKSHANKSPIRQIPSEFADRPFRVQFPRSSPSRSDHVKRPHRLHRHERNILAKEPDHGGLLLRILEDVSQRGQQRQIYHNFELDVGYDHVVTGPTDDDYHDGYYAFDDDEKRNPALTYDDPGVTSENTPECRRTSWHRMLLLNCNTMHEYDSLNLFRRGASKLVGQGSYRSVFLTKNDQDENESNVLKTYRFDHDFDYTAFEFMRMDALVAERLTGSPNIMNIYGNCGLAMIHEAAVQGNLEEVAAPIGNGRLDEPLDDEDRLMPQNKLTPTIKLEWSLSMAESVALLHSFPDGVIVHDDIQLPQFLLTNEGTLKLNDFNRAEIMLYNEKDGKYCGYRNNPGHGDWRAPEEYADKPLDEKIDVWSLGNNMYTLLTGLFPFYMIQSIEEIKKKIQHHEIAFIDPRWKKKSFAEGALALIIPLCWKFEPEDRIDIFELVKLLREAVEENRNQEKKQKLKAQKKNPNLMLALVQKGNQTVLETVK